MYAPIGEPLPGLSQDQADRFAQGQALFSHVFSPEEGLGPRFNENACNACHTDPADGGTGEQLVLKASHFDDEGTCQTFAAQGGENLRGKLTPEASALGAVPASAPAEASHRGRINTPFLFGMGMIDAIPQATLDGLADPDDRNGDGISGRVGRSADGRPARFGRKAAVATLADFVDEAARLEMGLTTAAHPDEATAGALPAVPDGSDQVADPELDAERVALIVDFVRYLAPPEPGTPRPEDEALVEQGRALFEGLGCSSCHVPALRTRADAPPPLAGREIALYSDLLLHDMGPDLAGPCTAGASPTEVRTEPLMGLRYRRTLLHDGRIGRVRDAILAHGGEAQAARDAFDGLDRVVQEALLRFLAQL
ncbi:MAG: di-heme oxidoredictase family protein [Gemmatimonadota bacterium]